MHSARDTPCPTKSESFLVKYLEPELKNCWLDIKEINSMSRIQTHSSDSSTFHVYDIALN